MRIVSLDVSDVMSGELVDGLLDLGEAAFLAHGQGGEVGVGTGAVPISLFEIKWKKITYFETKSMKSMKKVYLCRSTKSFPN